ATWKSWFGAPIRPFTGPSAREGTGWRFFRSRRSTRRPRGGLPSNLDESFEERGPDANLIPVVELRVGDEAALQVGAVGARQSLHYDVVGSEYLKGGVLPGDERVPEEDLPLLPSYRHAASRDLEHLAGLRPLQHLEREAQLLRNLELSSRHTPHLKPG